MQTPIPPTIPSSAQFDSVQIDQFMKTTGDEVVLGNQIVTGNFTQGGILSTINGQDQTYPASAIAGGMLQRTGLTVSISNDVMPSANDLAEVLGLSAVDGISYVRMFGFNNPTSYAININGTGWNFLNSNYIAGQHAYTLMYNLTYSSVNGWTSDCFIAGSFDFS